MKTILASNITPADGLGTAAYRFTLSETGQALHPWVTHFQNMEDSERAGNPETGKSWGHYFDDLQEAVQDFYQRVKEG